MTKTILQEILENSKTRKEINLPHNINKEGRGEGEKGEIVREEGREGRRVTKYTS